MKKGFTLVELLAIIVILGIIALIAYPVVNRQVELAQNAAYERTVASIEEAARRYGVNNNLGYSTVEQTLSLSTLVSAGELKQKDLVDPRTDATLSGCVYYKWNTETNAYSYRYEPSC